MVISAKCNTLRELLAKINKKGDKYLLSAHATYRLVGGERAELSATTHSMVTPAGFEPAISTLKRWRPKPLDDGAVK